MNMDEMFNQAEDLKVKLNDMSIAFNIKKQSFLESFTVGNEQIISDYEIDQQLEEMIITYGESWEPLNDQFLKLLKEIGAAYFEMSYRESMKYGNRYIALKDY